jgi:PAS domain S-box-containing protein
MLDRPDRSAQRGRIEAVVARRNPVAMPPAVPTPARAVSEVGADVLAAALDASPDGVALMDDQGRCVHVNPAGCALLGTPPADLLGRLAPFAEPDDGGAGPTRPRRLLRWTVPGSLRERELEYQAREVRTPAGRSLTAVTFRDVTAVRVQRRRFTAFATAAANVAYAGSLRSTLDAICAQLVETAGLAGAQIFLVDSSGTRMQVHGAAPVDRWPPDFALRLEEVRHRGAELSSFEALRRGRPVASRRRKAQMLADPRWAPLHDHLDSFAWDDFVAVPLVVRDRSVGALNAYCRPGHEPDDDEIAFLTAMAHQAAVAVENARLLAEVRGEAASDERHRLARELHDSACQRLFSLTLHIRAAELTRGTDGNVPDTVLRTLDELAHAALDDMRALIFELHPTLLGTHGLVGAVREQAAWITRRGGPAVTVDGPHGRLDIAPDAELDAYRLTQEALHNCVKHARATQVRVRIGAADDNPRTLLIEVRDDGAGFDPSGTASGLGLVSMRERAERLGGQLVVAASPTGGTVVRLVAPRVLRDPR